MYLARQGCRPRNGSVCGGGRKEREATVLTNIAKKHGMRTLKEDGDLKVKLQLTTESEVTRVCKLDIASD